MACAPSPNLIFIPRILHLLLTSARLVASSLGGSCFFTFSTSPLLLIFIPPTPSNFSTPGSLILRRLLLLYFLYFSIVTDLHSSNTRNNCILQLFLQ